ncbi:MAG: YfjI family protein, partial [Bacteroidales bacterium]|nr:YfjI family protein [Bacteroidales bacterium]
QLNLTVSMFLMPDKPRRRSNGEDEGIHPVHGSETGSNLVISADNQKWYCRRHGTGGGPLEALAVAEGIIACEDVVPGCLDVHWRAIFKALRDHKHDTDCLNAGAVAHGAEVGAVFLEKDAEKEAATETATEKEAVTEESDDEPPTPVDLRRRLTSPQYIRGVTLTPGRLAPENLVRLYHDAVVKTTDAYSDFITAAGIWAVSALISRRAVIEANGRTFQLNTWFMLLGQSTTSRKSTVINAVDEFIADLFPGDIYLTNPCPRLDDDWSPQSLIEMLDTDAGSQKWLCVDEAARLLADFERTYMSGVKDFLCKIYDGVDHKRQLRTGKRKDAKTEFHVKKPYLPLIAATTPDAFAAHVNPLDLKTGWLVRFLFVHPRGRKAFMPIGEYVPPSGEMEVLINRFRALNDVLSGFSVDAPLRLRLSPEAITVFANWQWGTEKLILDAGDETIASAYGRLIVYCMKLAGIYTLADADLNPLHGVVEIPVSHIETAIEQIDGYFLPMFVDTAELVERNHTQNLQTAILGYLREAGGTLTQRDILRKTRVKVRDLSEAISALAVSGDVKVSKPDVKGTVTVRLV